MTPLQGAPVELGRIASAPGLVKVTTALFAIHVSEARAVPVQEVGHGGLRFFALEGAAEMADRGEILDACTIIAIHRYQRFLAAQR
jgi:hypothetical protein